MTAESNNVDKCVNCEFYDRRRARPTDGNAPMLGQCRRHSPHLNPATAMAYVVEGVWPLVHDDDWCGEGKALPRMVEDLVPEPAALAAEDARQALHRAAELRLQPRARPQRRLPATTEPICGNGRFGLPPAVVRERVRPQRSFRSAGPGICQPRRWRRHPATARAYARKSRYGRSATTSSAVCKSSWSNCANRWSGRRQ